MRISSCLRTDIWEGMHVVSRVVDVVTRHHPVAVECHEEDGEGSNVQGHEKGGHHDTQHFDRPADVKDMGQQMGYHSLEWNWPKEAMNRPIWAGIVDGAKLYKKKLIDNSD